MTSNAWQRLLAENCEANAKAGSVIARRAPHFKLHSVTPAKVGYRQVVVRGKSRNIRPNQDQIDFPARCDWLYKKDQPARACTLSQLVRRNYDGTDGERSH